MAQDPVIVAKKFAARNALRAALDAGRVVPQPCSHCGTTAGTQGHHPDYDKPLEIIWLCRQCHTQEHVRLRILRNEYIPRRTRRPRFAPVVTPPRPTFEWGRRKAPKKRSRRSHPEHPAVALLLSGMKPVAIAAQLEISYQRVLQIKNRMEQRREQTANTETTSGT